MCFSPITVITAVELTVLRLGRQKYLLLFSYIDTFIRVNMLVTISPSRLLLNKSSNTASPFVKLYQTVSSAALPVLLSKMMQVNVAFVPSQNVSLAGF